MLHHVNILTELLFFCIQKGSIKWVFDGGWISNQDPCEWLMWSNWELRRAQLIRQNWGFCYMRVFQPKTHHIDCRRNESWHTYSWIKEIAVNKARVIVGFLVPSLKNPPNCSQALFQKCRRWAQNKRDLAFSVFELWGPTFYRQVWVFPKHVKL